MHYALQCIVGHLSVYFLPPPHNPSTSVLVVEEEHRDSNKTQSLRQTATGFNTCGLVGEAACGITPSRHNWVVLAMKSSFILHSWFHLTFSKHVLCCRLVSQRAATTQPLLPETGGVV